MLIFELQSGLKVADEEYDCARLIFSFSPLKVQNLGAM